MIKPLECMLRRCCRVQVVDEQNTAAIRDLCRTLQQHKLLESPHLHVRSLALEVTELYDLLWFVRVPKALEERMCV